MGDLEVVLSWLGMSQYLDRFRQAGFDSWETLQEITEDDLETLEVGLGYRRKLQREITNAKHLPPAMSPRSWREWSESEKADGSLEQMELRHEGTDKLDVDQDTPDLPAKRSYRHHPKPDPNAPDRPYSAYVLFSNEMREQWKEENLPFPDLSRQVGLRWQSLNPQEKERWKQLVTGPWDKYKEKVLAYQQTKEFRDYKRYVEEFKTKQAAKQQEPPLKQQRKSPTGNFPSPVPTSAATSARASSRSYSSPHPVLLSQAQEDPTSDPQLPTSQNQRPARAQVSFQNDSQALPMRRRCDRCNRTGRKCDGKRPACRKCQELRLECHFSVDEGKRDRERLLLLSTKLDESFKLFARIKPQLNSAEQQVVQALLDETRYLTSNSDSRDGNLRPILSKDGKLEEHVNNTSDEENESSSSEESAVGSMGSTEHVNQDDFGRDRTEVKARAYLGNASDLQWLRRLNSLLGDETAEVGQATKGASSHSKSPLKSFFAEDMDKGIIEDQIDPFGLPIKSTADHLVNAYFNTVHLALPILDRATFLLQYKLLSSSWYAETFEDRMFITMLQLVFAIAAVHAQLSGLHHILDDRDHVLYSARAGILAVDNGILNDGAHVAQVQVFGLAAMYCLVSDGLDRSWYLSGLSIRCAQSLGMHLDNVTPSMSLAEKEFQAQVWFALSSLERCLCMITGRPSMIHELFCTVSLPPYETGESVTERETSSSRDGSTPASSTSASTHQGRSTLGSESSDSPAPTKASSSLTRSEVVFFRHYLELAALAQEVLSRLYGPDVREEVSTGVHRLIESFDQRLHEWENSIRKPLQCPVTEVSDSEPVLSSHQVALTLFSHAIRILINRPCLCPVDTKSTPEHSQAAIARCVRSSQDIIGLLKKTSLPILLQHSPLWWLVLHHHNRAVSVILLELSYRAEHMPAQKEALLYNAKEGVAWIGAMGNISGSAQYTYMNMCRYFQLAARRVGADPSQYQMDSGFSAAPPTNSRNSNFRQGRQPTGRRPPQPSRRPDFLQQQNQQHIPHSTQFPQKGASYDLIIDPIAFSTFNPFGASHSTEPAQPYSQDMLSGESGMAVDSTNAVHNPMQVSSPMQDNEEQEQDTFPGSEWINFDGH